MATDDPQGIHRGGTRGGLRPLDPKIAESAIFASFGGRFGPGFTQRAVEAVRTYRTGNYQS